MPPVTLLAIAYGVGLLAGLVVLAPSRVILLLVLAGLAASGLLRWRGAVAGAWLLGSVAGLLGQVEKRSECRSVWQPGPQAAVVRLWDRPGRRGTTTASVVHAVEGCGGRLRVRMRGSDTRGGELAVLVGTYRTSGVFSARHVRTLAAGRSWRFAVRERIADRIERLYGARAPVVEALVLGRRDDLDPGFRRRFASAGLAHLLAISGLHVGVVAAWLALVCRGLGARRTSWLWSAALVWGYVALLGFPPPATRAAGFVTIYALARVRQRHPPLSAVLAVAVLAVLAIDRDAVTAVGAWLSVAAVWGVRAGRDLLPRAWRGHAVARLAAASLGATLATAPITAWAFGAVAPVGVVANLVAVPLAGAAVPGVFASLLGGEVLAAGAGMALLAIERVAFWAAALPGGHVTGRAGLEFALPWAALLGVFVWAGRPRISWRARRKRTLAVAVLVSWGSTAFTALERTLGPRGFALHVIDVGQGDAIAVRTPRGQWVLVDAGPRGATGDAGRSRVLPFLRQQGTERLAAMIVSHGDADHLGGVPAVVRSLDPILLMEPGQPLGTELYVEHLTVVDELGVQWRAARRGDTLVIDSVTFAVLHPSERWIRRNAIPNENSVVIHLRYRCFDALLAGDIGSAAEWALADSVPAVDLLKVAHHGSAGGTTERWLDVVRPRVAVISVGRNRYGHPAPEVLDRLAARGVRTYRTDQGGTVTIRSDGRYLEVAQGGPRTFGGRVKCHILRLLPLNGLFWNRSACIRVPRVISPACSTTSLSPAK